MSTLIAPYYIERTSISNAKNTRKTKRAIKKAFQNQLDGKGFSLVEILSSCPTNWKIDPVDAMKWVENEMEPFYPLGVFRDLSKEEIDTTAASC